MTALGDLTVSGAFMAIPGGAGMAVSYSKTAQETAQMVLDKTASAESAKDAVVDNPNEPKTNVFPSSNDKLSRAKSTFVHRYSTAAVCSFEHRVHEGRQRG